MRARHDREADGQLAYSERIGPSEAPATSITSPAVNKPTSSAIVGALLHSRPDISNEAKPRNEAKPTMSVTVVRKIDDDCAGSRPR